MTLIGWLRIGRRRGNQWLVPVIGIATEAVRKVRESVGYYLLSDWIRTGGEVGIIRHLYPACRVNGWRIDLLLLLSLSSSRTSRRKRRRR